MKRMIVTMAILALICVIVFAMPSRAVDFTALDWLDQALAEDGLSLHPSDLNIILDYDSLSIISVSPDGRRYLLSAKTGGALMIWDELGNTLKFIAPADGPESSDTAEMMKNQLDAIEEVGITWSADSRYIALSFIRHALQMMRLNFGTLLIDAEKGDIRPLVSLPRDIKLLDLNEDFPGVPFRAAFDPSGEYLFYESCGAGGANVSLNRYDLKTGQSEKLAELDLLTTTADPSLWRTEDGLMHTFADIKAEEFGLVILPEDGRKDFIRGDIISSFKELMFAERLIDVEGRHGILWTGKYIWLKDQILLRSVLLFSLDDLESGMFRNTMFIRPDAPPEARLETITIPADATIESIQYIRDEIAASQIVQPVNAALSPDGRYAMLAVQEAGIEAALYLYDIEKGICGRVDISALNVVKNFALYASPVNIDNRGIRWADNNRILLNIDGEYRVYELRG